MMKHDFSCSTRSTESVDNLSVSVIVITRLVPATKPEAGHVSPNPSALRSGDGIVEAVLDAEAANESNTITSCPARAAEATPLGTSNSFAKGAIGARAITSSSAKLGSAAERASEGKVEMSRLILLVALLSTSSACTTYSVVQQACGNIPLWNVVERTRCGWQLGRSQPRTVLSATATDTVTTAGALIALGALSKMTPEQRMIYQQQQEIDRLQDRMERLESPESTPHASESAAAAIPTAASVRAEDTATIAVALKDEASECRYLLGLCRDLAQWKRDHEQIISGRVNLPAEQRDAVVVQTMREYGTRTASMKDAARVIRAKHEKMPSCFEECGPELPAGNYR